jgi:hypothetical protein
MTLTFGAAVATLPGKPSAKKIVFRNTGPNTVYWGFEPSQQDLPLATNEGYIVDGAPGNIGVNVYFRGTTTGNIIAYSQQL